MVSLSGKGAGLGIWGWKVSRVPLSLCQYESSIIDITAIMGVSPQASCTGARPLTHFRRVNHLFRMIHLFRVNHLFRSMTSVGLMSAWRLRGARFVSVEAQDVSARLARKSVKFNGLEGRYDVRVGDLRDPNVLGDEEFFDLITGTPPYFPANGIGEESPNYHPQKQACRFEMRGSVLDYCQTAAR